MKLIEVSESEKDKYNRFVVENEAGSFLQSWEWGEWQEALGRQVQRFWINENENIGAVQLIKMPLPFGKYYLYAPYGPAVGGNFQFLICNFQSIYDGLISKFPEAVFIRIEPKFDLALSPKPLALQKTTNIQPAKTLIIGLTKPEEQLLAEMHPKTRYNIRLAQKHGVEIKDEFDTSIGHGLFAKEAVDLIVQTSKRQGFKGYGAEYYYKLIDTLALRKGAGLQIHIYKAIFKNRLLASAIMIDFGKTRTFLFGGSSDQDKNVMAPYLLHWQAMLDAKAAGLLAYDFWGVETSRGSMPGFVRFKLGFGGEVKEYAGAWDIVNNRFLYNLYGGFRYIHRLL